MIHVDLLKKVLVSLQVALQRSTALPDDLELRDACIQRFEYTFELSIRLIKRYLEQKMPLHEPVDQLNYRDLIRIAFEAGLILHVELWFHYREARNQTSHAYDEGKAQKVYAIIPSFAAEVAALYHQLEIRLHACYSISSHSHYLTASTRLWRLPSSALRAPSPTRCAGEGIT